MVNRVQLCPPFAEYSMWNKSAVMPGSCVAAVRVSGTLASSPDDPTTELGGLGAPGRTGTELPDHGPAPFALMARTRK